MLINEALADLHLVVAKIDPNCREALDKINDCLTAQRGCGFGRWSAAVWADFECLRICIDFSCLQRRKSLMRTCEMRGFERDCGWREAHQCNPSHEGACDTRLYSCLHGIIFVKKGKISFPLTPFMSSFDVLHMDSFEYDQYLSSLWLTPLNCWTALCFFCLCPSSNQLEFELNLVSSSW